MKDMLDRLVAQVEVPDGESGQDVHAALQYFAQTQLPDLFEEHSPNRLIHVDQLVVDIGPVAPSEIPQRAAEAIREALGRYAQEDQNSRYDVWRDGSTDDASGLSVAPIEQAIEHFLCTGRQAASANGVSFAELLQRLDQISNEKSALLVERLKMMPGVVDRLSRQLSAKERLGLSERLNAAIDAVLSGARADKKKDAQTHRASSVPEQAKDVSFADQSKAEIAPFSEPDDEVGVADSPKGFEPKKTSLGSKPVIGKRSMQKLGCEPAADSQANATAHRQRGIASRNSLHSASQIKGANRAQEDAEFAQPALDGDAIDASEARGSQFRTQAGAAPDPFLEEYSNSDQNRLSPVDQDGCPKPVELGGTEKHDKAKALAASRDYSSSNTRLNKAQDKEDALAAVEQTPDQHRKLGAHGRKEQQSTGGDDLEINKQRGSGGKPNTGATQGDNSQNSRFSVSEGENDNRQSLSVSNSRTLQPQSLLTSNENSTKSGPESAGKGGAQKGRPVARASPSNSASSNEVDIEATGSRLSSNPSDTSLFNGQTTDAENTIENRWVSERKSDINPANKYASSNEEDSSKGSFEGPQPFHPDEWPDGNRDAVNQEGSLAEENAVVRTGSLSSTHTALTKPNAKLPAGETGESHIVRPNWNGTPQASGSVPSFTLAEVISGTIEPAATTNLTSSEKEDWCTRHIHRDLAATVSQLQASLDQNQPDEVAIRLIGYLTDRAIIALLAGLAPTYGGLICHVVKLWRLTNADTALARAALALALSSPDFAPQDALEQVIAKTAMQLQTSTKTIARKLHFQLNEGPDHPGKTALADMLFLILEAGMMERPAAEGRRLLAYSDKEAKASMPDVKPVKSVQSDIAHPDDRDGHTRNRDSLPEKADRGPTVDPAKDQTRTRPKSREINFSFVNLLRGTLSEISWQQLAQQDMLTWCEENILSDLNAAVDVLQSSARDLSAKVVAARLAAVVPPGAMIQILAMLAPAYGGLIAYPMQLWSKKQANIALAKVALETALETPHIAPHEALDRLMSAGAKEIGTTPTKLAETVLVLAHKEGDHPAKVALTDILAPLVPEKSTGTLTRIDRTKSGTAKLLGFLRFGFPADRSKFQKNLRKSIKNNELEDILTVLRQSPAAKYRLAPLLNTQELAAINQRFPIAAVVRSQPQTQFEPQQAVKNTPSFQLHQVGEEANSKPQPTTFEQSPMLEDARTQSAGLVLLWPFLERFFGELQLWTRDGFTDDEAHRRAILLLHGLAMTTYEAAEPDLALEKVLCGLDHTGSTDREIDPTKTELDLSSQLLDAVRLNTETLKGSTNEALRSTFLNRTGQLTRSREGGTLFLSVEKGPFDMLLDTLSWQISTIRLPWMLEVLHVKWR